MNVFEKSLHSFSKFKCLPLNSAHCFPLSVYQLSSIVANGKWQMANGNSHRNMIRLQTIKYLTLVQHTLILGPCRTRAQTPAKNDILPYACACKASVNPRLPSAYLLLPMEKEPNTFVLMSTNLAPKNGISGVCFFFKVRYHLVLSDAAGSIIPFRHENNQSLQLPLGSDLLLNVSLT